MANAKTTGRRRFRRTAKAVVFVKRVGAKVQTQRAAAKLTQTAVARRLHVDVSTVSRIESGERDLRCSEVYELGAVLGVQPRVLLDVDLNGNG